MGIPHCHNGINKRNKISNHSSGCCSAWQAASEFDFILSALLQCLKNEIKKYHQRARRRDAEPMDL